MGSNKQRTQRKNSFLNMMGHLSKRTKLSFVLLMSLGFFLLILPACQKAKFSKDNHPRESRTTTPPPSQAPIVATTPAEAYNNIVRSHIDPRKNQPGTGYQRGGGGGNPDQPHPHSDTPEILSFGDLPPEQQQQYSHLQTYAQGAARFQVQYNGNQLSACSGPECPPPPAPAPATTPIPITKPTPPPAKPCAEQTPPTCNPTPPPPPPPPPPRPYSEDFHQPVKPITNKIDILFVMDTSDSIFFERNIIVKNLPKLLKQLLPQFADQKSFDHIDFKIAALPAHSPDSNLSGKLYGSKNGEPLILGNYLSNEQKSMDAKTITQKLSKKIAQMPGEHQNDAGEMGLLSLYNFLRSPEIKELKENDSFLRKGAAFLVIFVSDENDICYHYKPGEHPNYNPQNKALKKKHPPTPYTYHPSNGKEYTVNGFSPVELDAYNKSCNQLGENPEQTVHDQLLITKNNGPIAVSGILYTTKENLKQFIRTKGGKEKYEDENEVGHGYLDLINKFPGAVAADMGLEQYDEAMKYIGRFANYTMQFKNSFELKDPGEIEVLQDASGKTKYHFSVTVHRQNGEQVDPNSYTSELDPTTKTVTITPSAAQGIAPYETQPGDITTITWYPVSSSGAESPNTKRISDAGSDSSQPAIPLYNSGTPYDPNQLPIEDTVQSPNDSNQPPPKSLQPPPDEGTKPAADAGVPPDSSAVTAAGNKSGSAPITYKNRDGGSRAAATRALTPRPGKQVLKPPVAPPPPPLPSPEASSTTPLPVTPAVKKTEKPTDNLSFVQWLGKVFETVKNPTPPASSGDDPSNRGGDK